MGLAFASSRLKRLACRVTNSTLTLTIPWPTFGSTTVLWCREKSYAYSAGVVIYRNLRSAYCKVASEALKGLSGLQHLKVLDLSGTTGADPGFTQVKELPRLRELNLSSTDIRDQALSNVAHFQTLSSLNLGDTQITDEGIRQLATLKGLESLTLSGPGVTDACLTTVASLQRLEKCFLGGPKFSGAGLQRLASHPRNSVLVV